jgi:hypothetical protein
MLKALENPWTVINGQASTTLNWVVFHSRRTMLSLNEKTPAGKCLWHFHTMIWTEEVVAGWVERRHALLAPSIANFRPLFNACFQEDPFLKTFKSRSRDFPLKISHCSYREIKWDNSRPDTTLMISQCWLRNPKTFVATALRLMKSIKTEFLKQTQFWH